MPSTQPFACIRGPIPPERRARLDEVWTATRIEIEEYERPIREGIAWPIPPYRAVLIEADETVETKPGVDTPMWSLSVPAIPGALTHGRDITGATIMAREAICALLDTEDWGFQLDVETYPARPHDPSLNR